MFSFISKIESKIVNLLSNFAKKFNVETDKFAHLVCAFGITLVLGIIFNLSIAVIITSIISVGKEIYDIYKPNPSGFSVDDIKFDIFGMFIAILILSFFSLF